MRLALLLLALLLAACDSSTEPVLPLAGTYALESVSGAILPVDASFVDDSGTRNERTLNAATLTVRDDGTWEERRTYVGRLGPFVVQSWGTYEGDTWEGRHAPHAVTRTRSGLECEHADGLYRYRVTQ